MATEMKTCKDCKWYEAVKKDGKDNIWGYCYAWGFVQLHSDDEYGWPCVGESQRGCFRFAVKGSHVSHYTRIEIHN